MKISTPVGETRLALVPACHTFMAAAASRLPPTRAAETKDNL